MLELEVGGCSSHCKKIRKKYWWNFFWPNFSRFLSVCNFESYSPYTWLKIETFLFIKIFKIWKRQSIPLVETINLSFCWARFDEKQGSWRPLKNVHFRASTRKLTFLCSVKSGQILELACGYSYADKSEKILAQKLMLYLLPFFEHL